MTCSCNDEDSNCSTNEQSLFEKFLRKLTTPQARESGETGNPDIDNALRGTNSKRSIGGSSGGGIPPTPILVVP